MPINVETKAGVFRVGKNRVLKRTIDPKFYKMLKDRFDAIHTLDDIIKDGGKEFHENGYSQFIEELDCEVIYEQYDGKVYDISVSVGPGFIVYTRKMGKRSIHRHETTAIWCVNNPPKFNIGEEYEVIDVEYEDGGVKKRTDPELVGKRVKVIDCMVDSDGMNILDVEFERDGETLQTAVFGSMVTRHYL